MIDGDGHGDGGDDGDGDDGVDGGDGDDVVIGGDGDGAVRSLPYISRSASTIGYKSTKFVPSTKNR